MTKFNSHRKKDSDFYLSALEYFYDAVVKEFITNIKQTQIEEEEIKK